MRRRFIAAAVLGVLLASCAGPSASTTTTTPGLDDVPPQVHVTGATITPSTDGTAVIVFGAHNAGATTDRLLGLTCECGGTATLLDAEGAPIDGVDIAPEETLFLGPGTTIVSLEGFDEPLVPGSFVGLTVTFELAGDVVTDAEVAPEA